MAEKKFIQNLGKNIFLQYIEDEIENAEELFAIIDDIDQRMELIYANKFPKICQACKRRFETRQEYLEATKEISTPDAPGGSVKDSDNIFEYRFCVCGDQLFVVTTDRRDNSLIGEERRKLFDEIVAKLVSRGLKEEKSKTLLRMIFKKLMKSRSFVVPDKKSKSA